MLFHLLHLQIPIYSYIKLQSSSSISLGSNTFNFNNIHGRSKIVEEMTLAVRMKNIKWSSTSRWNLSEKRRHRTGITFLEWLPKTSKYIPIYVYDWRFFSAAFGIDTIYRREHGIEKHLKRYSKMQRYKSLKKEKTKPVILDSERKKNWAKNYR